MFEGLGITWPTYADWVSAGVALVIAVLAWSAAHLIARKAGPRLAHLWAQRAGLPEETLVPRLCKLVRYLSATIFLAVVVNADAWRPLSAIVLGTALAAAAALLISGLVRGLHMPRWIAWLLAGSAFIALLARVVGGLKPITDTLDRVGFTAGDHRFSLLSVVQILVTLVALYAAVKLLNRVANDSISRSADLDATQKLLGEKLISVVLLIAAFFIGIDLIGIDLTAFAVFSGAFGLAIGFGLQKTFGNLIAGIILLMDRSIKPGDVIVVGDSFGHVSKIGVRAVSIVTRDGKEHLIPNENLMTQEVENWSYSSPDVRVHIPVVIGYDCDLALAQKLMLEAANGPKRVMKSPAPTLWLTAFGERGIEHDILVWIADPQAGVGGVRSDILNRLWRLFEQNKIAIPSPRRDISIKSWPELPPTVPASADQA